MRAFPSNSRVAFIGDSITAENLSLKWIIRAYKNSADTSGIRFFNCGVAGGTADFAVTSYERDIKRYKPTHAVISFGINDSKRDLLRTKRSAERLRMLVEAYETYKARLRDLVTLLLADGVEVTLCTPVPYDEYYEDGEETLRGGYALMLGYAEYVRTLAKEMGVELYDQHKIICEVMASEQVHSPDRIHPTEHGYFILAREFLRAQGLDVGEESQLPEYFERWHSYVFRLRRVLAAECMLSPMIGESFDSSASVKIAKMQKRIDDEDWGQPVFECFYRAYVSDKPNEDELYRLIDEAYETDVF